jgi:cytochrome subunit of sulfide dehydrogenase
MKSPLVCLAAIVLASGTSLALAQTSAAPSGRYLAANCANCHGTAGVSQGAMPSLAGQDAAYLAEQMRQFRDGKRPATIMHQLAKGYTDEQIVAIAAHFAAQKK